MTRLRGRDMSCPSSAAWKLCLLIGLVAGCAKTKPWPMPDCATLAHAAYGMLLAEQPDLTRTWIRCGEQEWSAPEFALRAHGGQEPDTSACKPRGCGWGSVTPGEEESEVCIGLVPAGGRGVFSLRCAKVRLSGQGGRVRVVSQRSSGNVDGMITPAAPPSGDHRQ